MISPAKVNLTLEVGGLRPDGYHDIDSIAQVIDLADTIDIETAAPGILELAVEGCSVPLGSDNLVIKAAKVFFENTRVGGGARFRLTKRIPVQAGLGGGSSNAALALIALNTLYETAISKDLLASLAALVSSDASLFIYGGTLRVRGRGDVVSEIPDAPCLFLVIIKPECGVSTGWAYQQLDQTASRDGEHWSDKAEAAIRTGDINRLIGCLHNDFDPVITAKFPEIREAKSALLNAGAVRSILCGSGSAVFGVFRTKEDAERAASTLRTTFPEVFLSRTLSRSESLEVVMPK